MGPVPRKHLIHFLEELVTVMLNATSGMKIEFAPKYVVCGGLDVWVTDPVKKK
jgi:hypothetical protein